MADTCPRCGEGLLYDGARPAMSRADNQTSVCAWCGEAEAMRQHYRLGGVARGEWPVTRVQDDLELSAAGFPIATVMQKLAEMRRDLSQ